MTQRTGTILDYQSSSDFADDLRNLDKAEASEVRGRPATHQGAIQWLGPWVDPQDGFAEHTRRCASCLHDAGEMVSLTNNQMAYLVEPTVESQVSHLLNLDVGSYRLRVVQMVPSQQYVASFVANPRLPPEVLVARNKNTVLYVVTEFEGIGQEMAKLLNKAGMVWTTTERSRRMLEAGGVKPEKLAVVPMPYRKDDVLLSLQGRRRKPGPPRFLHVGKWEPRKAQHSIIGAFLLAFGPGAAELLVKTSQSAPRYKNYPASVVESARQWLQDERVKKNGWDAQTIQTSLRIVQGTVPVEQIRGMHAWSDVYVTLSHGEGFDMPAFDAKIAGNRLVYTASGGPEDFAASDDIAVPFEGLEPCDPWYQWGDEARWTVSTAEGAVQSLREAASRVNEPKTGVDARFSWSVVGQKIRGLLNEMGVGQ